MILTVDELREHVNTELGDDALQRLLDSAEEAIIARAGAPGARTEIVGGGYRFLTLGRPAASVTSITETVGETDTVLVSDDYLIHGGALLVERLLTGTNPRSTWDKRVTVVYTPVDDDATRIEVQIALCQLALNYQPGLIEESIGEWTERFTNNSAWSNDDEREAILRRLYVGLGMVVV